MGVLCSLQDACTSACLNGVLGTIAVAMVETRPFNYVSVCFWKRATFSKNIFFVKSIDRKMF